MTFDPQKLAKHASLPECLSRSSVQPPVFVDTDPSLVSPETSGDQLGPLRPRGDHLVQLDKGGHLRSAAGWLLLLRTWKSQVFGVVRGKDGSILDGAGKLFSGF